MQPRQIYPLHRSFTIVALLFSLAATALAASPFGPNLMPNPGFEEAVGAGQPPPGWKLVVDKPEAARLTTSGKAAEGKRCLSLELAPPDARGKQTSLCSPGVACEPGWHLASFWFRYEFNGKEQPQRLVYVERLLDVDNGRRDDVIYHYFHDRPAVSGQWDHTFILFRVRPEQKGVRFLFASFGKEMRLMLDDFSLRRLNEEALPPSPLEPSTAFKTGIAADPVADPAASEGRAWRCEEGRHVAGAKITWSSQSTLSPGLYRLTFRLRQERPSTRDAVQLTASGDNGAGFDFLRATDFKSATGYEDFTIYWLYPFGGGHGFNWRFPGSGAYRFDNVTAEKVVDATMPEMWSLLANGVNPSAIQPPDLPPAGKPAVLLAGLTAHHTGIEAALKTCGLDFHRYDLQTLGGNLDLTPALPPLDGVHLLIIADIPTRALSPEEQLRVRQFVEDGGGLLVFGGFFGYGHGGMQDTFVEEILPIGILRTFDRIKLPETRSTVKESAFWFPATYGKCAWIHEVSLKPGATVALKAGDLPCVVKGSFGKGRVMAVLSTVLGEPTEPFWENNKWHTELASFIAWLADRNN